MASFPYSPGRRPTLLAIGTNALGYESPGPPQPTGLRARFPAPVSLPFCDNLLSCPTVHAYQSRATPQPFSGSLSISQPVSQTNRVNTLQRNGMRHQNSYATLRPPYTFTACSAEDILLQAVGIRQAASNDNRFPNVIHRRQGSSYTPGNLRPFPRPRLCRRMSMPVASLIVPRGNFPSDDCPGSSP